MIRAVPLPVEVVISGSEISSGGFIGDEVLVRIWVVRSMEPAAQSAFNSLAKGKNLRINEDKNWKIKNYVGGKG